MSIFRRSRRRQFERAGGPSEAGPNGTLPRAQERVQQELERRGLGWGDGGRAPISAVVYDPPSQPRRGRGPLPTKRLAFRYGYAQLQRLRIQAPRAVLFCQQRQVRKEVLFAKRVAGLKRSPGRGGTYRRRQESRWGC